jgi:D-amino peptidase
MKIYVICDLEGTAGVVDMFKQCCFDGAYYLQARRLATMELNALVEGALEGGATEIVAWDGHGAFPGGLDVELLHPRCRLVMGAGDGGPEGMDNSFDAMFLCGLHGMAFAKNGILAHSFNGNIKGMWINEVKMGEVGVNILTAASYGIPTAFICGDRAGVEEARALVPEIEGVAVKEGLITSPKLFTQVPGLHMSPEKARMFIREGAKRAMKKIGHIAPYHMSGPYTCRTEFFDPKMAEQAAAMYGAKLLNADTVEHTAEGNVVPVVV